jgi:hypothetical protein
MVDQPHEHSNVIDPPTDAQPIIGHRLATQRQQSAQRHSHDPF